MMAKSMGQSFTMGPAADTKIVDVTPEERKKRQVALTTIVGAEEMAWGDAGLMLCIPGPGLGGPPVRASGTPEQKQRFFSMFQDMSQELRWGAYALTEPGAGSDVAGIRTSCRKDGKHWVINGRKCFITNGARASWNVVFATIDPGLGRAGHRAFVVEKGTPGFSVGKIEDKMGLRASETAELVFEDCRVPEENLLGGEDSYKTKEGFMTAMKTFDNTRPMVAAMAIGIGRAAYDYACDFVKQNYVMTAPDPALRGHRRAPRARGPSARRRAHDDVARLVARRPGRAQREGSEHVQGAGRRRGNPRVHRGHRDLRRRGQHRARPPAPREVVPRHQGLRHLRGHRSDPAHRRLQAPDARPEVLLALEPQRQLGAGALERGEEAADAADAAEGAALLAHEEAHVRCRRRTDRGRSRSST